MAEISLYFPQTEKHVLLTEDVTIAGKRSKICDLPLPLYFEKGDIRLISREHFKIIQDKREEKFLIVDLNSKNGTELNGQPLARDEPTTLHHADVIRLARDNHFLIKVVIESWHTIMLSPKSGVSGVYFDDTRAEFMVDGEPVNHHLAPRDKALLEYLYQNAGKVCSVDELIRNVWLGLDVKDNAIAIAIKRLRQKLNRVSPGARNYIETLHGRGYRLAK